MSASALTENEKATQLDKQIIHLKMRPYDPKSDKNCVLFSRKNVEQLFAELTDSLKDKKDLKID